jgi:hypothetical protein
VTRLTTSLLATAAVVAASAALAAPAMAAPPLPSVTITHYDNGTQVGTGYGSQPLLGVSDDSRGVCVGFSYEQGSCIPVTIK